VLAIFVGGCFLLIATHLFLWTRKQKALALSSLSWPRVPAKVLTSSISKARPNNDESDHLIFTYSYQIRSYTYTAKNINLFEKENLMSAEEMQTFVETHPVGAIISIQYNPESPQQCAVQASNLDAYSSYRRLAYLCLIVSLICFYFATK
jgi:hypothetical protein